MEEYFGKNILDLWIDLSTLRLNKRRVLVRLLDRKPNFGRGQGIKES